MKITSKIKLCIVHWNKHFFFQIRYQHLQLCFISICMYISFLSMCINISFFTLPPLTSAANCWHFGLWISATHVSAIRQNLCYKGFYLYLDTISARISDLVRFCISKKEGQGTTTIGSYLSNIFIRVEIFLQRGTEDPKLYFQYSLNYIKK